MIKKLTSPKALMALLASLFMGISPALASEADLVVPSIKDISPDSFNLLLIGIGISVLGLLLGFIELKNWITTKLWLQLETLFLKLVKLT